MGCECLGGVTTTTTTATAKQLRTPPSSSARHKKRQTKKDALGITAERKQYNNTPLYYLFLGSQI